MGAVVADASAIAEFIVAGARETPFDRYLIASSGDLHTPEICDVEMLSALRRMVRHHEVRPTHARDALAAYVQLPIIRHGHLPFLVRGFDLRDNVSPADAMYVALAEGLNAALLTADRRLARAVRRHTSLVVLP